MGLRSACVPALSLILALSTAHAAPGDILFIQGDNVNVRESPSTDAPVSMQLGRGHKLTEFGRDGDWVNVGIDRTGGKDGWIHVDLVGPQFPGGGSAAPADLKFDRFRAAVEQLNSRVQQQAGVRFFTDVENLGDGIVELTATDVWITAPQDSREGNLTTLFNLWDAADGSGLPISVRIVDRSGNLIMRKARQ